MVHVSSPLIAVMGMKTVLMAVMKLDVVGVTYCGYLGVYMHTVDIINLRAVIATTPGSCSDKLLYDIVA